MLMPSRLISIALAVLTFSIAGRVAFSAQSTLPATSSAATGLEAIPPIEFYLAKGEANACGPSCSQWIVAEGLINAGAAQRFRRLVTKLGHERPPVFFHSPGGLLSEGIEIGRIIREQKLVTSVGHTAPIACTADKGASKSCEAQKQSGQAVESAFDPRISMCNSACVYALAGGVVRLVPPDVRLGVHDVGLGPAAESRSKVVIAEAKRIAHEHIEDYLHDMGIDQGLYRAAAAIPFESGRFLDRDEVVRFGIDKREFGESPWRFVETPEPYVDHRFFARTDNDQTRYIEGFVALRCGSFGETRLVLGRRQSAAAALADATLRPISVTVSGQRVDLGSRYSSADYDLRSSSLGLATLALLTGNEVAMQLSGTDLAREDDGNAVSLDMHGFSGAFAKLQNTCGGAAGDAKSAALLTTLPTITMPSRTSLFPPAASVAPEVHPDIAPSAEPAIAQSAPSGVCSGNIPLQPAHVTGSVVAFFSDEEAQRIQRVEASLGVKMSAAYASLPRVKVVRSDDNSWSTMAAIPENMSVKLGDLVELNSRYWDQSIPCAYIPWTINRLIDHAQ
jgi:hypothetical protein